MNYIESSHVIECHKIAHDQCHPGAIQKSEIKIGKLTDIAMYCVSGETVATNLFSTATSAATVQSGFGLAITPLFPSKKHEVMHNLFTINESKESIQLKSANS